ncbi:unnamed protein product [Cladocopium goreaui]|uniref:Uncharacterized protein n=1 Tax=Cladocopium goreaui TaxID=2562237 RepID=A0A9P1CR74_9DINO|nr:unnamed protein product [Cladocopium goreaui]
MSARVGNPCERASNGEAMKWVALFLLPVSVTAVVLQSVSESVSDEVKAAQARSDRFYTEISVAQESELKEVEQLEASSASPSDLLPALAMLRSVYSDGKERIGKLNKQEEDSKKEFQSKEHAHDQKLGDIRKKFDAKKISEQFYQTEVKDENRIWKYWTQVRAHQHRQFLAALRVQHGTMKKVSHMIDLYEKTLAAKGIKG